MPNRIIREGILTSEKLENLGWAEEVFYRRVMSVVDDYGRYYAKPSLLRAACYPLLLAKVSDSDIEKWLSACENAALVRVYPTQDGKRYLEVIDFRQQVRAVASKYPSPDGSKQGTSVAPAKQMRSKGKASAHLDVDEDVDGGGDDKGRGKPLPLVFPSPLETEEFREAWEQYLAYRRQRSLPSLKPMSVTAMLTEMASWGLPEALQAIRSSIANGWNGIFKPKAPGSIHPSKTKPNIANSKYSHDF